MALGVLVAQRPGSGWNLVGLIVAAVLVGLVLLYRWKILNPSMRRFEDRYLPPRDERPDDDDRRDPPAG